MVGDGVSEEEEGKAKEGTIFIPFCHFPPRKLRKDCFYHTTPAMATPQALQNVDSCEVSPHSFLSLTFLPLYMQHFINL